jgi:hypothetical protein
MVVTEKKPPKDSYGKLKAPLVASHTLTQFQQVDRLVNMEGLGGRNQSKLITVMDKLKPKDPNRFYAYYFLQRMPRVVRILLAHDDLQDMRALAEKADLLMALYQLQAHVSAVHAAKPQEPAEDSEAVAAVISKANKKRRTKKRGGKQGRQRDHSPSQSIVKQSPLCWAHIHYKAYSCTKPCAWLENWRDSTSVRRFLINTDLHSAFFHTVRKTMPISYVLVALVPQHEADGIFHHPHVVGHVTQVA